jgi:hypothetical protein
MAGSRLFISRPPAAPSEPADSPLLSASHKRRWTEKEDDLLRLSIRRFGTLNWSIVAQVLPERTGKQCRERWMNQLNPKLCQDEWRPEEDCIVVQQQGICGNNWTHITQFLPGRSANAIKNRFVWLSRHAKTDAHPPIDRPGGICQGRLLIAEPPPLVIAARKDAGKPRIELPTIKDTDE